MESIAARLTAAALSQVGVRETRTNGGPQIVEYQKATWLPPGAWPWCAAFVCWAVKQAVASDKISWKLPRTAGAWDFENWARQQDNSVRLLKPHRSDIQSGDIVIFSFSHIGIATGEPDADGMVPTVEANTNGAESREGDGVYCKSRPLSKIRSRIRILK